MKDVIYPPYRSWFKGSKYCEQMPTNLFIIKKCYGKVNPLRNFLRFSLGFVKFCNDK